MGPTAPTAVSPQEMLEKVLSSEAFRNSGRSSKLLRFLVEHETKGDKDRLKEYSIGAEALGRGASFDPRLDSIVRVEVSRLRDRLAQYYANEGKSDPLVIVLSKGTYVPRWEVRSLQHDSGANGPWRLRPLWFVWAAVLAAVLLAVAVWTAITWRSDFTEAPIQLFDVRLLEGLHVGGATIGTHVVLSPDGNRIVFVGWDRNGVSRLFTRRLDQIDASEIPGTEGAHAPLFSPDGAWVAFTSMRDRKLKKVNVTAGSPIDLASVTDVFGASWGDNDEIVAKLDATPSLWRVPTNGGTPTAIPNVQLPNDADPHVWMQVLPGSRSLILTVALQRGFDTAEIAAVSLTDGSLKTLVRGGTFGRYAPSGHLVYVNQGTLYASPFNLDRMELRGSPKPVLGGLDYNRLFGYAQFDWSRTGLLAYRRSASAGHFDVYWIEGSRKRLAVDRPRRYSWPRISPDGNKLALVREESSGSSLWIETAKPAQSLQITSGDGVITSPVWSPDGHYLLFASSGNGIMFATADGSGKPRLLLENSAVLAPWSLHPGGARLAYQVRSPETGQFDLWTVALEGSGMDLRAGKPEPFLTTPAVEVFPTFSPDGKWLAYLSNRSGAFELYVRAFPGGTREIQLSRTGAMAFHWPRKASEIFYRSPNQTIMSVHYRGGSDTFELDAPRAWSDVDLADTGVFPNFAVTDDGGRVVALLPPGDPSAASLSQVTFAINFFAELQRRVGAGGH